MNREIAENRESRESRERDITTAEKPRGRER